LASVGDDRLVTDETWKCSAVHSKNWMLPSFDDAAWPNAAISGTNTASDVHKVLSGISQKAKWIWTAKNNDSTGIDKIVYCRGYISESTIINV
jgi:hypothetical protein